MRRTIARSVIIGTCVLFSLAMLVAFFLRSMQPKYKGELALSGLKETTEVLFDQWAIPHIYAGNEHDAYFTLGYIHAQDRLFQMEMLRRIGRGELAEILGPDLLKYDKIFRTLGTHRIGAALAKKLDRQSPEGQAMGAYIAGVNTFITTGPTPIEFRILGIAKRPFEIADSFSIAAYMAFSFVKALRTDPLFSFVQAKLGPNFMVDLMPPEMMTELSLNKDSQPDLLNQPLDVLGKLSLFAQNWSVAPLTSFEGSNAWAVSGKRTRSGKVLLASDPHIEFSAPAVWYEAHIETPQFALYGHYLAGVPVALLGHNTKHGWGITMLQNDGMDFFQETLNPDNSSQVWFKDHWEELATRTEIIKVKDQADIHLEIRSTRHGPIVNDVVDGLKDMKRPIALTWDFLDEDNRVLEAFYELARSENLQAAESAISKVHSPGFNITYANAQGDIAWWVAARFPVRAKSNAGKFILDGSTGEDEHLGYYPFSSHPKLVNPPEGFIVSANQNPFHKHPYQIRGYYNPDYRYQAIRKSLQQKDTNWSVDDIKTIQLETQNVVYKRVLDRLLPILAEKENQSPVDQAIQELLAKWDLRHAIDAIEPTVFHEFLGHLVNLVFRERLEGSFFDAFRKSNRIHDTIVRILENPNSPWWQDKDGKGQQKAWVAAAWTQTLKSLETQLGADPRKWNWGRVHTVEHQHVLGHSKLFAWLVNIGPLAANGSVEVINNLYFLIGSGIHEVRSGPSTRRVIDFVNPLESWGINPLGQSGYFANAHYRDQTALYHQGEYRLQLLDRKALTKAQRLVIRPAGTPSI